MKRSYWTGYLAVGLLVLAPAGVRMLTFPGGHEIEVDPALAQAGHGLFEHSWQARDPLTKGDGLGPVFNADSCVACHNQGGIGGGGDRGHNVTTFSVRGRGTPREGVIHAKAVGVPRETTSLFPVPQGMAGCASSIPTTTVSISQRNTPALFGACLLQQIPDREIIAQERAQRLRWGLASAQREDRPVGRARRLPDGRVGRFGWKAQTATLAEFVEQACANELGLGNPHQPQPQPLTSPGYAVPGIDLTQEQCDQLTQFVASLPRPAERWPADPAAHAGAEAGQRLFSAIGCADCHTPDLGPVKGLYSDLLLHRMGQALQGGGGGGYGTPQPTPVLIPESENPQIVQLSEWRTPPLWGVADSAPYLHDGRAATLREAIFEHGGQAARSAKRFGALGPAEQEQLIAFLNTLRAP